MFYIIGNWKCNPASAKEAKKILAGYLKGIKKGKKTQVAVCPPAHFMGLVKDSLKSLAALGAQDCYWENGGAFTSAISAAQLADAGCKYVIIGHSECRKFFGETNETVNKKIKAALAAGLTPIVCVGETREQRIEGKLTEVIESQIKEGLKDIDVNNTNLIIAYEPVWAIGTGEACGPEEAAVVSKFIGNISSDRIPLLYGGSVNAQNAMSYIKEAGYGGLLVGGVSLKPAEFCALVTGIAAL
jgi:triosephosphate isomerase (TIM)